MKIQCSGCEAAEATVLCCADEAALCLACDEKVHAANKLASKHHRIPLSSPSNIPTCDICQEASGYFFCLEDRALFCRSCDIAIHTANSLVSAHRRFLLTGVQVSLEHAEPVSSVAKEHSNSAGRVVESSSKSLTNGSSPLPSSGETNEVVARQVSSDRYFSPKKVSFYGGSMTEDLPDWPLDDFFGFTEFNHNYGFTENGSSKADSTKFASSEGSPPYHPADERLDMDECFGQVPDISYSVPEIPSPPTASGLHWQRNSHYQCVDHTSFVPDISSSYSLHEYQLNPKRRRPS